MLEGVIKDMVVDEPIDWSRRRKEILERLEKEEGERKERIERAKKLEKIWELMRDCREFIKENLSSCEERKEIRRRGKIMLERRDQKNKAEHK